MAAIYTNAAIDDDLVSQYGAGGSLVTIRTFGNDFAPGVGAVPSDFAENAYPGYPTGGITGGWSGPMDAGPGSRALRGPSILYTRGAGGSGEMVYGWYLTKETLSGTIVLDCERFPVPVPMLSAGQTLPLQPVVISARG